MNRQLTARSSLEPLRKEAKRWLKALHDNGAVAWERLHRAHPNANVPADPQLRYVQQALAREHGLASWAALKLELAAMALARSGREKLFSEFLERSCIHYGAPSFHVDLGLQRDEPSRWNMRLAF